MTQREFENIRVGAYCPVCGSREIDTSRYCAEHKNTTIEYSNLPDLNWGKKSKKQYEK